MIILVVVAGVSAVVSSLGDVGSQIGLQLLVYSSLGLGPFGALRPVWHTVVGFLVGVIWALVLILPGWLLSPHGEEQRAVAAVFQALADQLASVGTGGFTAKRQAVTSAVGAAYDELLIARTAAAGRNRRFMRLVAALNASNLMSQAATTLGVTKNRPPPLVIETVARLADAIRTGTHPPMIPPVWDTSPGALALDVCEDMSEVLGVSSAAAPLSAAALSRQRRATYRALGDMRAEFQRTMSEPPSISRRASAWWPTVVGLEQVLDAVTAVSLAVSRGARVPSSGVEQLCDALDAVSKAASTDTPLPAGLKLPDDETLKPITEAVRALLGVLASGPAARVA